MCGGKWKIYCLSCVNMKKAQDTYKEIDVEAALAKVNAKIAEYESTHVKKAQTSWLSRNYATVYKIAAVLIVGLIFTIFIGKKDRISVHTAQNAEEEFTLPDSTHIILDKNASISYASSFNAKAREVEFKGSGYFDVAPNAQKPFRIKMDNMFVEVLGTTFDIVTDTDKNQFIINLHTGKVKMYSVDEEGRQLEQIMLSAGERGVFNNASSRIERQYQTSSNNIFSSATGILDFNNVSLSLVIESLSKAYDIQIYLDDKYSNEKLTARFENETLESVFETLAAIYDFQIVRIGNTVTIR